MTFKSIDLFGQLALAIIFGTTNWSSFPVSSCIPSFAIMAFVVLQITSLIVHAGLKKRPWKEIRLRKAHLIGTGVVLMIMLYGLVKPTVGGHDFSGLDLIVQALIPAAAVALFYIFISFLEWMKMKKQDIIK